MEAAYAQLSAVQKGNHIISKIIFSPYSTFLMISLFKVLTYFDNRLLSMVIICETFITDSFGNLLSDFLRIYVNVFN